MTASSFSSPTVGRGDELQELISGNCSVGLEKLCKVNDKLYIKKAVIIIFFLKICAARTQQPYRILNTATNRKVESKRTLRVVDRSNFNKTSLQNVP
jgi:hypothetical protein